ncbi:MAG: DUF5058 family protein [Oscillospiraceae bacterium]|nr:DUF5058 family protein [Oscillospiraceae bacterium]
MDFKTGTLMYFLAAGVIAFVIIQSVFFMVKAWKRGKEIGIENEKMKQTVISSVLFTIAPAVSVLATVLALASALGIVLPWIRLSVIGNLAYETVAAESAVGVFGSSLANEIKDPTQFSTIAWTMTIGSCFPLVLLPILCKKIHKATQKITAKSGSANALGDILGAAAFIGIIAAFISRAVAGVPADGPSAGFMSVSVLLSAMIFTIALDFLCRKKNLTKLEPFVLPIAMFGAMGIAILFTQTLPQSITEFTWR